MAENCCKIVISAYPGYGKTRTVPAICQRLLENVDRVLVLTRSIVEVEQLLRFFQEQSCEVGVLVGRERLCPLGASSSLECSLLRSDGKCQLYRIRRMGNNTKFIGSIRTLDELVNICRKLSLCPYDYACALAAQSRIVLTTVSYLSTSDLVESFLRATQQSGQRHALVIDEAHAVATGIEHLVVLPLEHIRKIAEAGNEIAKEIAELEDGEELVLKRPHVSEDSLRLHVERNRETVKIAMTLMTIFRSELVLIKRKGSSVEIRTFNIENILKLVENSEVTILLSASITSKFVNDLPLTKHAKYVEIGDVPEEFSNLKIYIVRGIKFTKSFRTSLRCSKLIKEAARVFMRSTPPIGGCAILFSSREFMLRHVDSLVNVAREFCDDVFVFDESDKTMKYIEKFKRASHEGRVLLITYIGNPAMEGLNFLGDELVSLMIVGFPYPEFSTWNEIKRKYLMKYVKRTFKCTYLFPAISYTIQAVGRVTRDLSMRIKRVVLLDDRFWIFRKYLPSWMCNIRVISFREYIESFGEALN